MNLPTLKQYHKWSWPSKFGFQSWLIGIIALAFAVFVYLKSSEVIGIDNTKKSLQNVDFAKKDYQKNDFASMLIDSKKAVEYDDNISAVEYLGFSYLLSFHYDSCERLLLKYEDDLTTFGNWCLSISLNKEKKFSEAFKKFESLDIEVIPEEFKYSGLQDYLQSSFFSNSLDSCKLACEKVGNLILKKLNEETYSEIEVLVDGRKDLIAWNEKDIHELPAYYFLIGYRISLFSYHKDSSFQESEIDQGLSFMKRSFGLGLRVFDPRYYTNFFESLQQISAHNRFQNFDQLITAFIIFRYVFQQALLGKINFLGTTFNQPVSDVGKKCILHCIDIINQILPANWASMISQEEKVEIEKCGYSFSK